MLRGSLPRAGVASAMLLFVIVSTKTSEGQSNDAQGFHEFPQPEVRRSAKGLLATTLEAKIADNVIQDPHTGLHTVRTPTYEGTIPGPTLRVKPGDFLAIQLINNFPTNPEQERMGAFPHDRYTTNLHTHGLTVSPLGISDNVFREMEPGTTNFVLVKIPRDHPSGTFWYHPHKHGAVTFQLFGGMAGFLIIQGGPRTLDTVPEVQAAEEVLMAFQVVRTDKKDPGQVPFVYLGATQFGTNPPQQPAGLWSTLIPSNTYVTTNGAINPTLHMRPGEVQRWRLLAAGSGEIFVVALCNNPQITPQHPQCVVPPGGTTVPSLNIIANDGITIHKMRPLAPGDPYVMGSGQRADLLVKAGPAGNTYYLMALNPAAPKGWSAVSGSGIDPAPRQARISFDTPLALPAILATIVVSGTPINMQLPVGPLPVPKGLPRIETMLDTPPNAERHIAFENCGDQKGVPPEDPKQRLPTCGWYFDRYDADYWGGTLFHTLLMMRDDDDKGVPNPSDPEVPLVNFQKEGLFTHHEPLFDDMIAGNFEEWTVVNRSFSDHTFHIHQNPFLLTHLNGKRLPVPEWHDTIIVPAAELPGGVDPPGNINTATFGSITFRTHFAPETVGSFVMHCHMLQHEDIGMMQRLKILPRKPNK